MLSSPLELLSMVTDGLRARQPESKWNVLYLRWRSLVMGTVLAGTEPNQPSGNLEQNLMSHVPSDWKLSSHPHPHTHSHWHHNRKINLWRLERTWLTRSTTQRTAIPCLLCPCPSPNQVHRPRPDVETSSRMDDDLTSTCIKPAATAANILQPP